MLRVVRDRILERGDELRRERVDLGPRGGSKTSIATNSSPPSRALAAFGGKTVLIRSAATFSTRSPAAWPWMSLTVLK